MEEVRRDDDSLKKRHFARLHERIQSKYVEMQRKLEKSKSVDSLSSLKEDYVYKEPRYASSSNISMIDETPKEMPSENHSVKHSVIIEEIYNNNTSLQYVNVREAGISESEVTPYEMNENENDSDTNKFFGEEFSKMCLES